MEELIEFINKIADIDSLRDELARSSMLCINDFLSTKFSSHIYDTLDKNVNWDIAYYSENKGKKLTFEEMQEMPEGILLEKIREIKKNYTANDYQFFYHTYMIVTAYLAGKNPGHLLHFYLELINSPPFLMLMRKITGCQSIIKMDAQATYYAQGDFLKEHNDADTAMGRRYAYVLNMTNNWIPDWGGILHFTKDDQIYKSFVPSFNRLTIFKVPSTHFVSQVADVVGEKRLAITGWMYDQ